MRFKTVAYFLTGALALWLLLSEIGQTGPRAVEGSPEPLPRTAPAKAVRPGDGASHGLLFHGLSDLPEENPLVGILTAPETVELVATETGRVRSMRVAAGDRVDRGELLAEIAPDDLDLQKQAQEAKVREAGVAIERARLGVEVQRRRVQRREGYPDLFSLEDREETDLELQRALLELEAAMARKAEGEAQLAVLRQRLGRSRIVAPIDGLVSERWVDPGAAVSPGQPVLELVDAASRIVRFAVPADHRLQLTVGRSVRVALDTGPDPALDPGEHGACATIERISPKVEESAPLLFVEARLATGTLPGTPLGAAVRVHVLEGEPCDAD